MAAAAAEPGPAPCQAARDAALAHIAAEEAGFRAMLDADAAVLDAPTYHLTEAERMLRADLAAERARAEKNYRACLKARSRQQNGSK
jgi:hypothetical protein